MENAEPETFFSELVKLDPELSNDVQEVQKEAFGEEDLSKGLASGALAVGAVVGSLWWTLDSGKGTGSATKKGTGAYKGNKLPDSVKGQKGTYKLALSRVKAKLELYDSSNKLLFTYNGVGLEKGLTGDWTGTWKA